MQLILGYRRCKSSITVCMCTTVTHCVTYTCRDVAAEPLANSSQDDHVHSVETRYRAKLHACIVWYCV